MSRALPDGTRWLLLGGKRVSVKVDGSMTAAERDPPDLRQLVVVPRANGQSFHGVAGDTLLAFDGAMGKHATLLSDARLREARVSAFAGRLLVRPGPTDELAPFLVSTDGTGETPLGSALPFEASSIAFGSTTIGFAVTETFGLLRTDDGAAHWARAEAALQGDLLLRQGVPALRSKVTGKASALAGFALTAMPNDTSAFVDERGRDPLAIAAASGLPLAGGDVLAVDAMIEGSMFKAQLLRVSPRTGELKVRRVLGSFALPSKPTVPGEIACSITETEAHHVLIECEGGQHFELDDKLEVIVSRAFPGKLRQSAMGGMLAEGSCEAGTQPNTVCVRRANGQFSTLVFEKSPASVATLTLPRPDGSLVLVDYESQGFATREVDLAGTAQRGPKFGSRVKAAKIHGDLDQAGNLTLVVEGATTKPLELPQVEVTTIQDGRVKTDSFPGALTGRNVGGRVVLRSATEIIVRDGTRAPWQRFPRRAAARGEVRLSQAGFVAGEDVRLGWPIADVPVPDAAAPALPGPRELICTLQKSARSLPRLDNSVINQPLGGKWTRVQEGRVAVRREGARYRVRFFSKTTVASIEEFFVTARSFGDVTIDAAVVRGTDIALLLGTAGGPVAIRRAAGVLSIESIVAPATAAIELTLGADGSVLWDRGTKQARRYVFWPKIGAPRDFLTGDSAGFRFEPAADGVSVFSFGPRVTSVARFGIGEKDPPLSIEPKRFKAVASLGTLGLSRAPPCPDASKQSATPLFDLRSALTGVIVDGERLNATSFETSFSKLGDRPCAAKASVTTDRSRWQIAADLATGDAVVAKSEYQRLPASCVLQQVEATR